MNKKIILKLDEKKIILPYDLVGLKQLIQFLELEEKQLEPKKGRKMEVPLGVAP